MEPPVEPKPKKPLTEKQLQALKKCRTALVKSREEKRQTMHQDALSGVVEKAIQKQLLELQEKIKPVEKPLEKSGLSKIKEVIKEINSESEHYAEEEPKIIYKKKPKTKIVYISSSESEEPEYKPKPKPKSKPVKYLPPPEPEMTPQQIQHQNVNEMLFKSIFGR